MKFGSWGKISSDGKYIGFLVNVTTFKVYERINNFYISEYLTSI